jgi:hypothetical protein
MICLPNPRPYPLARHQFSVRADASHISATETPIHVQHPLSPKATSYFWNVYLSHRSPSLAMAWTSKGKRRTVGKIWGGNRIEPQSEKPEIGIIRSVVNVVNVVMLHTKRNIHNIRQLIPLTDPVSRRPDTLEAGDATRCMTHEKCDSWNSNRRQLSSRRT